MPKFIKRLFFFILTLLVLMGASNIWWSMEPNALKKLGSILDELTDDVIQRGHTGDVLSFYQSNPTEYSSIVERLVNKYELCSIIVYADHGVAYNFKCKNDSYDNFIDYDEEYYLVRTFANEHEANFLSFEQFRDYAGEPIDLGNNWYFFEKKIYFD